MAINNNGSSVKGDEESKAGMGQWSDAQINAIVRKRGTE